MHISTATLMVVAATLALANPAAFPEPRIEWAPCSKVFEPAQIMSSQRPTALQCGTMRVPMDWDNPSSVEHVTLGITKRPARKPSARIGNLFWNPGGPGAAPSDSLRNQSAFLWPGEVLDRFDIIGVDLRGSGLSSPINCSLEALKRVYAVPSFATTEETYGALLDSDQELYKSCLDYSNSNLVDFMDTVSIARDHEAVRKGLGNEKLSWLGHSYGTQLGLQYAELFPNNIRAMALDAPCMPVENVTASLFIGASAVDQALRRFFEWCNDQDYQACRLAHVEYSVEDIVKTLIWREDAFDIPTGALEDEHLRGDMDGDIVLLLTEGLKAGKSSFPSLASALYDAYADYLYSYTADSRADLLSEAIVSLHPLIFPLLAISSSDSCKGMRSSPADMLHKQQIALDGSRLLGGWSPELVRFTSAVGWPSCDRNPPHAVNIPRNSSMPPILLVASVDDPATPSTYAKDIQADIGLDRVRLITVDRVGHTVYNSLDTLHGRTRKAINKYLLDLELPEEDHVWTT